MQGLLSNLQDWELSLKDKDKKMKSQGHGKETLREDWSHASELSTGPQVNRTGRIGNSTSIPGAAGPYDYPKKYNPISHLSGGLMSDENNFDANSEKELGNEFFKQKKFDEAIDCYSRSIALSPTAVAYANRAMSYLKIKRFQEAENDCTEALNLDDRYIKAYSRRSTPRKELGKLKESIEDAEFALRLEPQNQEIKKQYAEVKAMYEKEILKRVSGTAGVSAQGAQKSGKRKKSGPVVQSVSSSSQKVAEVQKIPAVENNRHIPGKSAMEVEDTHMRINNKDSDASVTIADVNPAFGTAKRSHKNNTQELKESVQELVARTASVAKAEAAKNIAPPTSVYQFEVSWRGLSGDRNLQTHLLKVTSPTALPQIFKNALSAPMLMDIVRCVATFFMFDMIIMCLSSTDKAELVKIWDEVFCKGAEEYAAVLGALRLKYGLRQ